MKVVTLLIDTLRYDFMGFNGNTWIKTPNLDHLAAQSVVFDGAYIGSYPCMPARRDLWTGKFEFPFRGWGSLEYDDLDLATVITVDHGILSMLISDHYHLWEKGSGNYHFNFSGYDFIRGQEYDKWKIAQGGESNRYPGKQAGHLPAGDFELNRRNGAFRRTETDYFPAQVMMRAADWIEQNRAWEDFFLLVDCFDPHEPFDPPPHYIDLYDPGYEEPEIIWPTYGWNRLNEAETRHVRALYAGEISMTDRWVGYLLDKLEQLRLLDDTMIVVTTDHGHMFGEHGLMGKPWAAISDSNMYQEVSHIPLVVYHPQLRQPGTRIADLVQLVDLYPTILAALDIAPPPGIHGHSLLPYVLDAAVSYRPRAVACYGRFGEALNITDGAWTLFIWPPGDANGPLHWYAQLPPEFGPYQVAGPRQPGQPYDRWPVSCARGEMRTQLFNIGDDPAQLHDQAHTHPQVVGRLMQSAADFLGAASAPIDQFERLGLPKPKVSAYAAAH